MSKENTIFYKLTTIDPVILSQSTISTNEHSSLDHISGGAILGLAAGKLYQQDKEQNWRIFHSGQVQFRSAYLAVDNEMALPIPASFHLPKGEKLEKDKKLNTEIINKSFDVTDDDKQLQQVRVGFVNSKGVVAKIKLGRSTKTAINRETGSVEDGQLFSYAHIEAGQSFLGAIHFDQSNAHWLNDKSKIEQMLNGEHRIGRSRGSEFGRVQIQILNRDEETSLEEKFESVKGTLTLWCIEDCQCVNEHGLATFTPTLNELLNGSSNIKLNTDKSFILTKTVTRYNQARKGMDSEQLLISKGSVLVFDGVDLSAEQIKKLCEQGIGLNRQQGLGKVIVNPAWAKLQKLANSQLFAPILQADIKPSTQKALDNEQKAELEKKYTLLRFARQQQNLLEKNSKDQIFAKDTLTKIIRDYQTARFYKSTLHAHDLGPSRSQWRRLLNELRNAKEGWHVSFFTGENAICKAQNDPDGWGVQWQSSQDGKQESCWVNFADSFKRHLNGANAEQVASLLEMLCRHDLSRYSGLQDCCEANNIPFKKTKEEENL